MKQFDLIVFDWDGTLMDSAAIIVSSIMGAARDAGLPQPPDSQARHVIGLGLKEALAAVFPEADEDTLQFLLERYRHHYLSFGDGMALFAGAREMVSFLHGAGHMLAVATGKSRRGLDSAFEHTGIRDCFHGSRCADECFSKPHPSMLIELMDELGVGKEKTLMIGDTTHDLLMAKNAGVRSVGVTYGAHPRENLEACSPLALLNDLPQLRQWLEQHA